MPPPHVPGFVTAGEALDRAVAAGVLKPLREALAERRELLAALKDLLPYATACVGLPREAWPDDSVILRAERIIAKVETA